MSTTGHPPSSISLQPCTALAFHLPKAEPQLLFVQPLTDPTHHRTETQAIIEAEILPLAFGKLGSRIRLRASTVLDNVNVTLIWKSETSKKAMREALAVERKGEPFRSGLSGRLQGVSSALLENLAIDTVTVKIDGDLTFNVENADDPESEAPSRMWRMLSKSLSGTLKRMVEKEVAEAMMEQIRNSVSLLKAQAGLTQCT